MSQNLIITAAFGYAPRLLVPFVETARQHCPGVTVLVLLKPDQTAAYARYFDGYANLQYHVIKSYRGRPQLWWNSIMGAVGLDRWIKSVPREQSGALRRSLFHSLLAPKLKRYIACEQFIRESDYENILICDSRDVFFQSSPFAFVSTRILSGIEPETFGGCPHNTEWLKNIYPESWQELMGRPIICSGVTIGNRAAMLNYLQCMADEIWNRLPLLLKSTHDQTVHNRLIYTDTVPADLTANHEGKIATLHYEPVDNIGISDAGISLAGHLPSIVHQWDRHACLVEYVNRTFFDTAPHV